MPIYYPPTNPPVPVEQFSSAYLYLDMGYTTPVAKPGGLVVNYLPTATTTTVNAPYVAGVAAVSNPTVGTVGVATFAANDFVLVTSSTNNPGIYEVLSHAGHVLTVRGVGTVACVENFTQDQFYAGASDGATITKINLSVLRAGTDGLWEVALGAVTPLAFGDLDVGGSLTIGAPVVGGGANRVIFEDAAQLAATDANFTYANSRLTSPALTLTQIASVGGTPTPVELVTGAAHTNLAAGVEAIDVKYALNRTVQFATGAIATQRTYLIQAATYGFVAASTITNVGTFVVSGPPILGANATFTNKFTIWAQSGFSLFESGDSGATSSIGTSRPVLANFTEVFGTASSGGGSNGNTIFGSQSTCSGVINTIFGYLGNAGANNSCVLIGGVLTATAGQQFLVGNGNGGSSGVTDAYYGSGVVNTTAVDMAHNATGASGANLAGTNHSFNGARSTGRALGGSVFLKTSPAGGAGSGVNALVNAVEVKGEAGKMLLANRNPYLNAAYTTVAAQTGGLAINYLPTATTTTVNGVYTQGVAATSNPTVGTTGAATFTAADLVQISLSTNNCGLFEVLSHAANVLTVRGVGLTACVEDFTQSQFRSGASDGATITKVNVSVMRTGTDGLWESGKGSATPLTFTDVGLGTPYDVGNYVLGLPGDAALVFAYLPPRTIAFTAGLATSRAKASVASTGTAIYTILKNGVGVGTITFTTSATGVFAMAADQTFTNADELTVTAPTPQDATLSAVRFTLSGTRVQ